MSVKTVKLAKIRKLFKRVNGGDDVDAAAELQEILENMMAAARDVVDTWEVGDLAGNVSNLEHYLDNAEGRK